MSIVLNDAQNHFMKFDPKSSGTLERMDLNKFFGIDREMKRFFCNCLFLDSEARVWNLEGSWGPGVFFGLPDPVRKFLVQKSGTLYKKPSPKRNDCFSSLNSTYYEHKESYKMLSFI